jgi:glutathione synthase/RimK-type ligase-like ATP-grasp enzyme
MKSLDVTILTAKKFFEQPNPDWYVKQVLREDEILLNALKKKGLKAIRTYWDNPDFNFADTEITLFRTIWDYFHRFEEFSLWLNKTLTITKLINPPVLVYWNIDKHYFKNLSDKGINIPPTLYIEKGEQKSLSEVFSKSNFTEAVLKPAVSGAGRHTYKISKDNTADYEVVFKQLTENEAMLIQEYQENITKYGEIAIILFNGIYSHSVLKTAKSGEFRVQDDFGGSVKLYNPTKKEINFAEKVLSVCSPTPLYARVDIMRDNENNPVLGELELIEPELWFRLHQPAAEMMADAIIGKLML